MTTNTMTLNQFRRYAKDVLGIEFSCATSHGGGNRDHRSWHVEFSPWDKQRAIPVTCQVRTGSFDGKAACRTEAVRIAWTAVAARFGITISN